jgi:hypothetical protein
MHLMTYGKFRKFLLNVHKLRSLKVLGFVGIRKKALKSYKIMIRNL